MPTRDVLLSFEGKAYLNLETYKKNEQGVRTPVWFVQNDSTLYVRTVADSWKVKRLRNRPQARIAPCDMRGNVHGDWIEITGREIADPASIRETNQLFRRKYGIRRWLFEIMGVFQRRKYVLLALTPQEAIP